MIKLTKKILPSEKFAIALSGGVDSIAAAHFLKKGNKPFIAFHVNAKYIKQDDHCEEQVRAFCKDFSIPLVIKECNEVYRTGSIEAWCREQRYRLLLEACKENDIKFVTACHHLDDCVESYLMNCFNGKPEHLPIPFTTQYDQNTMTIIRPFLLTSKKDFQQYIHNNHLQSYVTEDELNGNLKLKRNWIRHSLRPIIELQYPGIKKVVKKLIESKLK